MLTLHLSRIPDQAADSLHQAALRAYQKGRRVDVVVPNQYTVEAEQALMELLEEDVLFDLSVRTFSALEKEIFFRGQGYRRPVLSDLGRTMILRLILENPQEDWKIFRKEVRGKSFLPLLSDQLREFKEYGLKPEDLIQMGEIAGGSTQIKLEETARLIRLYEARIQDRFEDADGRMERAFGQKNAIESFRDTDFFFDYFHSLSDIEMNALGSLLEVTDAALSLVLDPEIGKRLKEKDPKAPLEQVYADIDSAVPDASAFSLSMRFFEKLLEEANFRNIPVRIVEAKTKVCIHPALIHASENLFSYSPKKKVFKNPPIFASLCRNTQQEVDKAIIEINRLIQKGARYRDVQLIYMDDEEYLPMIKKKFEEENLPYFLDESRSIQYHPLVRAIESALEIIWKGPGRDRYFRFLKAGILDLDEEEVEIYQKYVIRHELDNERLRDDFYFTFDEETLQNYPKEGSRWKEETETAKKVKDRLEKTLSPLLALGGKRGTLYSYTQALVSTLLEKAIQDSLKAYEEKLIAQEKREEWETHRQLWDQIMDLFDQLVQCAGDEEVSFDVFAKTIQEGLENLELGIIPPYQDQIFCSGLFRTRTRTRPYVFMVGLNDTYLPKGEKDAGLFSREEKAFFRSQGYILPSMAQVREEEERLDFYSAILKVGKELHLSSSRQNVSNESMEPSFWLQSILDHIFIGPDQPMPLEEVSSFNSEDLLYSKSLRQLLWPEKIRQERKEKNISRAQSIEALKQMGEKEDEWMVQALSYDNQRPPLSPLLCALFYKKEPSITASILEAFGACPYNAFVRTVLKPQEDRILTLNALDTGILFHQSLNLWSGYIKEHLLKGEEITYSESREAMQEALLLGEKKIFEKISRMDPKNAFLLSLAAKTLDENHQQTFFQLKNAKMVSLDHELSFGPGKNLPPYPLIFPETGEKFFLAGTIDRIDRIGELEGEEKPIAGQSFIRVIDYKTGKRTFDFERLFAGLDLQLPLYLKAASSLGKPVGFFYMPIRPVARPEEEKTEEGKKGFFPLVGEVLLDGVLLKEENAVRASDFTFPWDGSEQKNSLIYKLGMKNAPEKISEGGKIIKEKAGPLDRENFLDEEDFSDLLDEAVWLAGNFAGRRSWGEISPAPFRSEKNRACRYCPYSSLCRFEGRNQFKNYRMIGPVRLRDWKGQAIRKPEGEKRP